MYFGKIQWTDDIKSDTNITDIKNKRITYLNKEIAKLNEKLKVIPKNIFEIQKEILELETNSVKKPDISWKLNNAFIEEWHSCDSCGDLFDWGNLSVLPFPDICDICLDVFEIENLNNSIQEWEKFRDVLDVSNDGTKLIAKIAGKELTLEKYKKLLALKD